MMRTHACNSDSDPDSERDEDTPAGALALPPKLCSGREVFCTTRNVAFHPSLRNERPHIFGAALPHKPRIHPDWAESVNPALLETHIGPLLGDKTTLRDPGRSNAKTWRPSSHISVACQNVTGSSQPYSRAGAWRLGSRDLGCGAGREAFLYRNGSVLAGRCRNNARFVASGVFCDSNAGSPKLGAPVLDYFSKIFKSHTRQRRERPRMIPIDSSLESPASQL